MMNLYVITDQMVINLSNFVGASNGQFFDIRYSIDKISGGKRKVGGYYVLLQKELQEFFSEIKVLTKTKATKKGMMEFIKSEIRNSMRQQ